MILRKSIVLGFEEEDMELWELLDRLPADQQAVIVKEVLLKHFKEFSAEPRHNLTQSGPGPAETAPQELNDLVTVKEKEPVAMSRELSLDALFEPKVEEHSAEVAPKGVENFPNPLKHLFEMIGEEDDEEVLGFFSGKDEK